MLAAWWRFTFQRCKVCDAKRCPVWGALGNRPATTPATYLMHRGFQGRKP